MGYIPTWVDLSLKGSAPSNQSDWGELFRSTLRDKYVRSYTENSCLIEYTIGSKLCCDLMV